MSLLGTDTKDYRYSKCWCILSGEWLSRCRGWFKKEWHHSFFKQSKRKSTCEKFHTGRSSLKAVKGSLCGVRCHPERITESKIWNVAQIGNGLNDCDATVNGSNLKKTYTWIYIFYWFILYQVVQTVNYTQSTIIHLNVICSQTKIEPHKNYF